MNRKPQNVLRDLPESSGDRKEIPVTTGVLDYFPLALAEVARISLAGNRQHNPGQPLHWARHKSRDHADCISRHLIQRGSLDSDGARHSAKLAWRALALLQEELEADAGFVPESEVPEAPEAPEVQPTPSEDPLGSWSLNSIRDEVKRRLAKLRGEDNA